MPQSPIATTAIDNFLQASALGGNGVQLFQGGNQSGVTTSVGLATAYTGLCLSNPANSGVRLILRGITGMLVVAPAALTSFNLITGFAAGGIVTHTTPLSPGPALIGGSAAPSGLLDSACTLVGTPVFTIDLGLTPTATSVTSFALDLKGAVILSPGAYAAIGTTIAGPASGFIGSMQWLEQTI